MENAAERKRISALLLLPVEDLFLLFLILAFILSYCEMFDNRLYGTTTLDITDEKCSMAKSDTKITDQDSHYKTNVYFLDR